MATFTLLLTSNGQEWLFHIATDMQVVNNGSFTMLLTSNGQEWKFHFATDIYHGEEQQFHIANDILMVPRMAVSHCNFHIACDITNGNFTLLLISSGQEWQFHIQFVNG